MAKHHQLIRLNGQQGALRPHGGGAPCRAPPPPDNTGETQRPPSSRLPHPGKARFVHGFTLDVEPGDMIEVDHALKLALKICCLAARP
jgi:hypothetical protein